MGKPQNKTLIELTTPHPIYTTLSHIAAPYLNNPPRPAPPSGQAEYYRHGLVDKVGQLENRTWREVLYMFYTKKGHHKESTSIEITTFCF